MNQSIQGRWQTRPLLVRILICLAVVAATGTAGVYLHEGQQAKLRAFGSRLAEVNNEVAGLKAELSRRQQEATEAGASQSPVQGRASLAAHGREPLLPREHFSALLDDLMRLAQQDGIQVISISPGVLQDHGGYVELPINLQVQARFRNLGEYLHQVQQLRQVVLVGRVRAELTAVEQALLTVQMDTVSFVGKA
ncbi:MAG TPA: type 4a pilus biogenesis protein PilO [Nitrospiria bacterium]|nr:type 4a pilus biogenesis protein PilO [Nitrospiria bacterium]